ncbi:MAG: radical SAM protein [Armatimonadetes bacterium]|nr:radical SAM protein [Armatimonadota bacterium]
MRRIDIKLGYSCNDRCVHCVVDDFRDILRARGMSQDKRTEQFLAEMETSRARGEVIVFTGGEPTIRKDLPVLLERARDLDYAIHMQSNGRRFANSDFADKITAIAPITYCIALHGPTAEVHDAVTRTSGAFHDTERGIRNLVARRQVVSSKIVLSKLNQSVVSATVRRLAELGACHVSIAFPHALGTARKLWDVVVPRYRDVMEEVHAALDAATAAGMTADAETFPFCMMEGYERFVSEIAQQLEEYAEVRQYGDERETRDWSEERLRIKQKFPQCRGCRYEPVCEGPWTEYAERYGAEEFRPLRGQRVNEVAAFLDGSFRHEFPFLDLGP